MKKVLIAFVFLIWQMTAFSQAQSKDVSEAARIEYEACFKETVKARKECTSGGCGNILGSCYERQVGVFENDSENFSRTLTTNECHESKKKIETQFFELEANLQKIAAYDNTWSGMKLRVGIAQLKNKTLRLLGDECFVKK